ncbi:rhodanese-like domain-containing protein [Acidihalobacter ferrooxydans]|uniref:Sulfurtransferase n=1 Tax=Acidihalobacter ferrooxydans TaxID=1765967 RepID=A0A1P8UJI9_9GAMM|nr:rhodanese-like domain-containing protein [Acidihalobacter ferrooxydans]APZ44006.1 sulfurtransferase [Acidihalobacter ferrooxydans]
MDTLDTLARNTVPTAMGQARIGIDDFITPYNEGRCELLDIRVPEETAVWQLNFGLRIPANELPDRLDELPRDTLLVVACPMSDRSNMARSYLTAKGFQAKYLAGGLLGLVDRLKGGAAKHLAIRR